MALKSVWVIRLNNGAYSNCFYESFKQAFGILESEIPIDQHSQYEIVEIKSFKRRVN